MSAASFYLGLIVLIGALLASWYVARRLRRRLMPDWEGSPGVLAEVVVALAILVAGGELLGLFGLLKPWSLLLLLALLALVARLGLTEAGPGGGDDGCRSGGQVPRWGAFLALGVTAVLVGQWASFATNSLDFGITNFDSVWYHLPFSAEMARTGSVLKYLRTETVFVNWFYPQNSELLHAIPMVFTGRDFFSVLINFGWLALALHAAWNIGRPWNRSHLTLAAAAVVLASHTLVVREPGTAKNDIVVVALLLSSVAVLLNIGSRKKDDGGGAFGPGWPLALAGLAAGLAAGTKYTALAPVVLITVAVGFTAFPGVRLRALGTWLGGVLAGGGFWYLRNLLVTGNPVPQVRQLGPLELPGPERLQEVRPDFSVAHYLTDWQVWSEFLIPGLERGFGPFWPVLLALVFIGPLVVLVKADRRLVRALALVALGAALAYLFTPLGASGPEGSPVGFAINLRFLAPALVLALVLVALLPVFSRPRAQAVFAVVAVVLFLTAGRPDALYELGGKYFGLAVALVFVLIPGIAWLVSGRERSDRRTAVVVTGLVGLVAFVLSWPLADRYFDDRYRDFEPENGLAAPYRWANGTSDSAIGLAGTVAGFRQYGFFGADLSNRVTYLGEESPAGGFQVIEGCRAFFREIDRSGVEYVVTSPFLNFAKPGRPVPSPESRWVEADRAFRPVVVDGPVSVWRLTGEPDPSSCLRLPANLPPTPGLISSGTG